MNLIYTLLTLAAAILLGSAGVFLAKKKLSNISTTFAWFIMWFLLLICCLIGAICEEQVNGTHILTFLPWLTTGIILIYGIILGICISFIPEVRKELKKNKKIEWITLSCITVLTILPIILWGILMFFSSWNCWNDLCISIVLGITLASALWLCLNFAWILKYGFSKIAH